MTAKNEDLFDKFKKLVAKAGDISDEQGAPNSPQISAVGNSLRGVTTNQSFNVIHTLCLIKLGELSGCRPD